MLPVAAIALVLVLATSTSETGASGTTEGGSATGEDSGTAGHVVDAYATPDGGAGQATGTSGSSGTSGGSDGTDADSRGSTTATPEDTATSFPPDPDETASSSGGADPTWGPLDDEPDGCGGSSETSDEDPGCCDSPDNNSDNFLCSVSPRTRTRMLLTVALLLLGRPRRRRDP